MPAGAVTRRRGEVRLRREQAGAERFQGMPGGFEARRARRGHGGGMGGQRWHQVAVGDPGEHGQPRRHLARLPEPGQVVQHPGFGDAQLGGRRPVRGRGRGRRRPGRVPRWRR